MEKATVSVSAPSVGMIRILKLRSTSDSDRRSGHRHSRLLHMESWMKGTHSDNLGWRALDSPVCVRSVGRNDQDSQASLHQCYEEHIRTA
jgi:hypothetical protein